MYAQLLGEHIGVQYSQNALDDHHNPAPSPTLPRTAAHTLYYKHSNPIQYLKMNHSNPVKS